jgi:hypothetical protein
VEVFFILFSVAPRKVSGVRMCFAAIKQRDGSVAEFGAAKSTAAIPQAGEATGEFGEREARRLTMWGSHWPRPDICRMRRMWKTFRTQLSRYCLIHPLGQGQKPVPVP